MRPQAPQGEAGPSPVFTQQQAAVIITPARSLSMNPRHPQSTVFSLLLALMLCGLPLAHAGDPSSASSPGEELRIEITKKGLGKEVVISQGAREWFMLIEVTPENSVVVRQEKDHDKYLVDESETHDRPMTPGEVDAAIADYVNSVKTRAKQ